MVCSVTEGEDKPLKYPLMFRTCELVLVNKIDLLPHLDFDLDRLLYNIDQVHPDVETDRRSARAPARASTRGGSGSLRDRRARGGACVSAGGARRRSRRPARRRCSSERTEANRRFFEREAERLARLCHLMAERFAARRPADRVRPLAGGALGRAPRRGRVRPSGDRRQARAAGDRARRRGRRARARRSRCSRAPDDIAIAFGADEDGGEAARGARARARAAAA